MTTRTFDMQLIRYVNLFSKVTRTRAKHCFIYNNTVIFVVSKRDVSRSIGKDNSNLRRLSEIILKKIRIVGEPSSDSDIENFISIIVSPVKFKSVELNHESGEAVISAGRESKARLIGRERVREKELSDILKQYFQVKKLKIA